MRCKLNGVVSENPPHGGSLEISRGGGGSQRPNLFRGGSKAALVFQTGGAKLEKKSSVGEVRITHILHGEGITHSFLRFCLTVQMKPMYNIVSGGSRGGARGTRPPYFKTKLKG